MPTEMVSSDASHSLHPQLDRANEESAAVEQSVLGAMMLSQDARIQVPATLKRKDLYRPKHATIWDAIANLVDRGEPADAMTVGAELDRMGVFQHVGGAPYLHTLIETVPTAVNASYYADQVKQMAVRRTFAEQGKRLIQLSENATDVDELEQRVADSFETCLTAADGPGADQARPVGEDDALMDEFVANLGQRPESAFSTGISDLDRAMIAKQGALILLSADTGVGKSLLAAQIARHYARDREERVLFHSLEMTRDEMLERDMSAVSGVSLASITGTHDLSPTDHDLIRDEYVPAYRQWANRLHYVEGRCSVSEVRRKAQRLAHEHRNDGGLGLIVVDYLQIMQRPRDVSIERDDLALAAMTSALKDLAMDLGCIVVAISQFSNEGAKADTPKTHHLKGSSSLAQDADVVALMADPARHDESRAGEVEVLLPKVRKGVSGTSVGLAEQRHKAHFHGMGDTDRSAMSVADRVNGGMPSMS